MPFKKGQSGNPKGRAKGSVNYKLALKTLIEEVFKENESKCKNKIVSMLDDPKNFKFICELKAQYEVKEMPNRIAGEDGGEVRLVIRHAISNLPE